jgi:hypothetical protein
MRNATNTTATAPPRMNHHVSQSVTSRCYTRAGGGMERRTRRAVLQLPPLEATKSAMYRSSSSR